MLRRVASLFVLAFLVVLAMLFVALNQQHFEVDVAFLEVDVSSGLALLIAFAAGLLAGALARARWVAELLAERGRLRQALRLAETRLGAAAPTETTATTTAPVNADAR